MKGLLRDVGKHGTHTVGPVQPSLTRFLPALTAGAYPFLLRAFHLLAGPPNSHIATPYILGAALILITIFAVPAVGLACAALPGQTTGMRRLAYASVTASTVYVFLGVIQSMVGSPYPDEVVWCALWLGAAILADLGRSDVPALPLPPSLGRWRVAHGCAGALISIYVIFHLANHLVGLIGPAAHASVMNLGRSVYRTPMIEPVLVLALLFQVCSGLRLAWRWSAVPPDFHRLLQIGSGCYMAVFILGHLNSVFVYARSYLGIPTDWAFASGAPTGLIHDPWNIRLLPHYALGVFFVLTHLASAFRVVLIAHGVSQRMANRLWAASAVTNGVIALAIVAGLCGVRLSPPKDLSSWWT